MDSSIADDHALADAWARHRVWSKAASQLKARIRVLRRAAVTLAILTAVLAVASEQVPDGGLMSRGRLAGAAALCAGAATLVQQRLGADRTRTWTRLRAASEAMKSEIYQYLARGGRYADDPAPSQQLRRATAAIGGGVAHLGRYALPEAQDGARLPEVRDAESYVAVRLVGQIDGYYVPSAVRCARISARFRGVGLVLGVVAVALAATSAGFGLVGATAWIPVLTTCASSLVAYASASRYDYLVDDYLATAHRLRSLRDEYLARPVAERRGRAAGFVSDCEHAILTENQGWMARVNEPATLA